MQPERRRTIELQCAIDFEKMEVRSHLDGSVAGVPYFERRHRTIRIEGDRIWAAHVAAHRHIGCRRIDIGGYGRDLLSNLPC